MNIENANRFSHCSHKLRSIFKIQTQILAKYKRKDKHGYANYRPSKSCQCLWFWNWNHGSLVLGIFIQKLSRCSVCLHQTHICYEYYLCCFNESSNYKMCNMFAASYCFNPQMHDVQNVCTMLLFQSHPECT